MAGARCTTRGTIGAGGSTTLQAAGTDSSTCADSGSAGSPCGAGSMGRGRTTLSGTARATVAATPILVGTAYAAVRRGLAGAYRGGAQLWPIIRGRFS